MAPFPGCVIEDGEALCVQCTNDTHCADDHVCDLDTHLCAAPFDDPCDACMGPYPACVEHQGDWVCVECAETADCDEGCSCDHATWACDCPGPDPGGECVSEGCLPGTAGWTLYCDSSSGLCYEPNGQCDGVTAYCRNGFECVSILDGITGGGGLPGLSDGTGVCQCQPSGQGLLWPTDPDVCGSDASCVNFGNLMSLLGYPDLSGTGSVCFDMSALIGL